MEFTNLNNGNVSRIGLGTWALGGLDWGNVSDQDAIATCLAIFEHGINLIDTAPVYGNGRAEEVVGKAIREHGHREDFYIATKAGLERGTEGIVAKVTPERLRQELSASLTRLDTDYIDLYQIHWPDTAEPLEAAAEQMLKFYDAGAIRAIGVSNFSPEQMDVFRAVAPLHSCQPPYNIFERAIDADVLPYCRRHSIAVLAYSAICRSLLGGRLAATQQFDASDIRSVDPKFQQPRFSQYLDAVARLDRFARERYGKRVLHLALRWVLDRSGVSVALFGARHPAQLEAVEEVMDWNLDAAGFEEIDAIVTETVLDPVGPEYLAPAHRISA
ncbi:putative aldo/keto reductase [Acidisarcina polymorpha]|uniref:Putative aldo/keto reductase n=1 Tax=Acidisarcina polymorpha TaxID=2211140 RepID=A0A2Z5G375_9BACT|nr:aldo/keto reductase [Acidisarcina polymorpha]AXC13085.1 putative aldo/keto reductase [Acidisarcina polymorpha]